MLAQNKEYQIKHKNLLARDDRVGFSPTVTRLGLLFQARKQEIIHRGQRHLESRKIMAEQN
jgi:hypothetical protein